MDFVDDEYVWHEMIRCTKLHLMKSLSRMQASVKAKAFYYLFLVHSPFSTVWLYFLHGVHIWKVKILGNGKLSFFECTLHHIRQMKLSSELASIQFISVHTGVSKYPLLLVL